jgi:hypothetical protein
MLNAAPGPLDGSNKVGRELMLNAQRPVADTSPDDAVSPAYDIASPGHPTSIHPERLLRLCHRWNTTPEISRIALPRFVLQCWAMA